jgi:hypothetical protein
VYPDDGVAVSDTDVPELYVSVQSLPQLMPEPVMVPPVGADTVRVYVVGVTVRVAEHCAVIPPFVPAQLHV